MTRRFPFYARILLWLSLNLLLLVAVFYVVLRVQFHFGLDVLIGGRGGDRIQGLANGLAAELGSQPRADWDNILSRFGGGYGVQLALVRMDGTRIAGDALTLPVAVLERLRERPNPRPEGRPPPSNNEGQPGPADEQNSPGPPRQFNRPFNPAFNNQPGEPGNLPPGQRPGPGPGPGRNPMGQPQPPNRPRFMVRTTGPVLYWVGVQMPALEANRPNPPLLRMTLIAASDSLRGGGLFFDYTPWLLAAGAVLALSVLFWLPLVRGITRAISQMTAATEQMAAGRFDGRVPETRGDELGALAAAINRMALRLSGFVTGQKRFLGDIAHELCAPLARLQMALGILEQRADEKQRPYVEDLREEIQHMSSLVNELLSFSKAGLQQQSVKLETVALAEIISRVVEREGKTGHQINVQVDAALRAQAEPELLSRALANLLRNAIRYAGDAGPVSISAARRGPHVVISVADEGAGVPEEALPKLFDPFYRLEASRSRDTGGVGLGLAIVKTCVEACGGTVSCHNRQPRGLEAQIRLPAA